MRLTFYVGSNESLAKNPEHLVWTIGGAHI